MQEHVGVAVTDRLAIMRNVDSAQAQRPARRKPMCVVPNAYPHVEKGIPSLKASAGTASFGKAPISGPEAEKAARIVSLAGIANNATCGCVPIAACDSIALTMAETSVILGAGSVSAI